MNQALQHVHAAVHLHTQAKQDWLEWIMDRLEEIPTLPVLNRRFSLDFNCVVNWVVNWVGNCVALF
jgi:hypothetical protein